MTRLSSFQSRLRADFAMLSPRLKEAARWVVDHPADVALLSTRQQARRESEGDAALVQDVFASLPDTCATSRRPTRSDGSPAAADRIAGADRISCLGLRSSFAVAYIFHYARSLFGAKSVLVDGAGGPSLDVLRTIGCADVVLAVSVKPYVRHTIEAARYARRKRARVIVLTDSELSPLRALADVRTETPSFFHSMIPGFAAVERLAALVAARTGRRRSPRSRLSELADFGIYDQPRPKGRRAT